MGSKAQQRAYLKKVFTKIIFQILQKVLDRAVKKILINQNNRYNKFKNKYKLSKMNLQSKRQNCNNSHKIQIRMISNNKQYKKRKSSKEKKEN